MPIERTGAPMIEEAGRKHPQLKFALYDLKQPPCADIHEAVKTIDQMMYTLENWTLHSTERLALLNDCDALGKFIRASSAPQPAAAAEQRIKDVIAELERRKRKGQRQGYTTWPQSALINSISYDEAISLLRGDGK